MIRKSENIYTFSKAIDVKPQNAYGNLLKDILFL